jgi:REP element-mobilizing transposase RayT
MAVYLLTFHAYRSWNADHPRGYVRRGHGVFPPEEQRAIQYDMRADQLPVLFDEGSQRALLDIVADACHRRGWRLHAFASEPSHVHLLVSWREFLPWEEAAAKLKNLMSWQLGRTHGVLERRWFSRGGSRKRVADRRHFEHLVEVYLPRHRGVVWREGEAEPPSPDGG